MKTKIVFESSNDMITMREGDHVRNFEVLGSVGKTVGDVSCAEWELNEYELPILQHFYQYYCEKNNLQVTKDGYAVFRDHALHFGFKFEEETAPVFFDASECWPEYDETVYAFYADGSEGFAKIVNAEKSNTPFEPDYWCKFEDGTDDIPLKWCRTYPYLFDSE